MKKLILLVAVTLFSVAAIHAQTTPASLKSDIRMDKKDGDKMEKREDRKALRKLEGEEVSYQSKQAFETDFGNIKPTSTERLDNFDEFSFTKNGKNINAFYDIDSKLVGTIQDKTFADLPSKARENIRKHYKDYTPGDVVFYDDNEDDETDMILYGLQFQHVDSYFVEMKKGSKKIVLQVMMDGNVSFFTQLT